MGRVLHGALDQETCFEVVRHKYAGGGYPGMGGYIEALEIKNGPLGKCRFVLSYHREDLSGVVNVFFEFAGLAELLAAFERVWGSRELSLLENTPRLAGFKRVVNCGSATPWFYATKQLQSGQIQDFS